MQYLKMFNHLPPFAKVPTTMQEWHTYLYTSNLPKADPFQIHALFEHLSPT